MDNVIRFEAHYSEDVPKEYIGNPYIEAMPPLMSLKEYFELILFLPKFDPQSRGEDDVYRKVKIAAVYKYVVPNIHFYDLYQTLWRMLFTTYSDRNSFETKKVQRHYSLLLLKQAMDKSWTGTTGESLLVVAPSGFGKTFIIRRVLQSLPQVIDHTEYNGKPFKQPQVLWIYLKISSNANRKSLCQLFLEEVDKCVGTEYASTVKPTTQQGVYETLFRTIIETYKIGLLVIDEMKNLSVSKAGGDQEFLNFFSELAERWRMGLVLIGTPDILPILKGTFTSTRRLTAGGDKHFERYEKNDPVWVELVKTLWPYQYVTTPCELYDDKRNIKDKVLFDEIYKLTQGIPFVFTFLFVHAQFWVIESTKEGDDEKLTISSFRHAFNNASKLIKIAVEDIRDNGGKNYPDLMQRAMDTISPAKKEFILKLELLLKKKTLSPKAMSALRKEIGEAEEKYILNDVELEIIERVKQGGVLDNTYNKSNVIEGQYEEVG